MRSKLFKLLLFFILFFIKQALDCSTKFVHDNGLYSLNQQTRPLLPSDFPYFDCIGRQKYPVISPPSLISMIVVPNSNNHKAKHLAAAAYQSLKKENIDNLIIIAQADDSIFHGVALSLHHKHAVLLHDFELNRKHIEQLAGHVLFHYYDFAHEISSSFHAQMQFIEYYLHNSVKITPLLIGQITHKNASEIAEQIVQLCDERTLVVFSADVRSNENLVESISCCSLPLSQTYDEDSSFVQAVQGIPAGSHDEIDCLCNRNAFIILLKMLQQPKFLNVQSYFVGYDASIDQLYQDRVESYASFIYQQGDYQGYKNYMSSYEQLQLSSIAKKKLYSLFESTIFTHPFLISYEMTRPYGLFVSLYAMSDHGILLRGCMGKVRADAPLYQMVLDMTEQAACCDQRFYIMTHQELKFTMISVSIVTNLQQIFKYENIQQSDGILFEYEDKSSISLPSTLPVYHWDYQETLTDLSLQAGMYLSAWRQSVAKIFTFQTTIFQKE